MLAWVALAAATLVACELLMALPLRGQIGRLATTSRKAGAVLRSAGISDHWKEAVLPAYAGRIAAASLLGFLFLLIGLAPLALPGLVWPGGWSGYGAALQSPWVIAVMSACCIPYVWWRGKATPPDHGYSFGDRLLHRLTLGTPILPEALHDVEKALYLAEAPDPAPARHLFVTGLARAGTTVLLREIHGSGRFGSLTYDDMPMVLAPNLWSRLSGARTIERHERAHGDGIEVDGKSPEALDEVFWRVHDGAAYLHPDHVGLHRPDEDLLNDYNSFVRLVLRRTGKDRYLSKNNNNIIRLAPLAARFPDALFLVPFRDPLDHAASLLRQHRRFRGRDGFTTAYMGWLGHHEFGDGHRPFALPDRPAGDPDTIDYWLSAWIAAYRHLEGIRAPNLCFVCFETLQTDPACWTALTRRIGLPDGAPRELSPRPPRDLPQGDPALMAEAAALYARLAERSRADLA